MGHHVTGLIARRETFAKLSGALGAQRHFALKGGFGFLPLDDENLDDVVGPDAGKAIATFEYLTPRLIEVLRSASKFGRFAYVETEYHGGSGAQGAAVFRDGEVAFGPRCAERGPINEALAMMGVSVQFASVDAFETIGLDRHRTNEAYREAASAAGQ